MDAFLILVVVVLSVVGITGATVFACEYLVREKQQRVVREATQEVAAAIVSSNQTVHHNGIEDLLPNRIQPWEDLLPNRIQPWTRAEREAFGIDDTEKFIRETDRIIKAHEWAIITGR